MYFWFGLRLTLSPHFSFQFWAHFWKYLFKDQMKKIKLQMKKMSLTNLTHQCWCTVKQNQMKLTNLTFWVEVDLILLSFYNWIVLANFKLSLFKYHMMSLANIDCIGWDISYLWKLQENIFFIKVSHSLKLHWITEKRKLWRTMITLILKGCNIKM